MPKYTVCTTCIEILDTTDKNCNYCGSANLLYANDKLIEEGSNAYFFAYQNRLALEYFIKKHGSDLKPSFHQLGPSEILAFVALSALSGVTWDVSKVILLKILESAKRQGIRIRNEFDQSEYPSTDEQTIVKLIASDEDLVTLSRYIKEYQDEYKNADVHEFVIEESLFLNREIIEQNNELMNTMRISLEKAVEGLEVSNNPPSHDTDE